MPPWRRRLFLPRVNPNRHGAIGSLAGYDAVVIVTDHDAVDYRSVVAHAKLVIDTRNVCGRLGIAATNVFRA